MTTEDTEAKKFGLKSFRRNKPKKEGETSESGSKPKKFKRIRGLLTGESRRERKAKREAARAAALAAGKTPPPATDPTDEEETVYGVDVDSASVQTGSVANALLAPAGKDKDETEDPALSTGKTAAQSLQVILLLMDPKTRRFELLQLEFDSNKAVVRDVLSQVPHSVTEEALRKQKYTGVCDRTGQELFYSTRLADACGSSDILIALPANVEARECARLARPILQDRNVIEMLRSSGVDTRSLEKKEAPKAPAAPAAKTRAAVVPPEEKKKSSQGKFFIILIVAIAILTQVVHMSVTAPLNPGHRLSPNAFMSRCGYKAFLPSCEEASLIMNEDGILTLYGSDGSIQWEMVGGVCEAVGEDCKNGLVVNDDGTLTIGGKRVQAATVYGDSMLTPWPFTESPNVRLIKGRK